MGGHTAFGYRLAAHYKTDHRGRCNVAQKLHDQMGNKTARAKRRTQMRRSSRVKLKSDTLDRSGTIISTGLQ